MLQSKRKQKIESGSEKLLFSKLDAFFWRNLVFLPLFDEELQLRMS